MDGYDTYDPSLLMKGNVCGLIDWQNSSKFCLVKWVPLSRNRHGPDENTTELILYQFSKCKVWYSDVIVLWEIVVGDI